MKTLIANILIVILYISMTLGVVRAQAVTASPFVPPQIIQTNLVAQWNFSEGFNQIGFNRAGASTTYQNPPNLLGPYGEEFQQANANAPAPWLVPGTTLTDFFATDPNGVASSATRMVMASGSSNLYYTLTLSNIPYTFSVWAKSNTGSAQAFRIGNASSPGADQTITTSWQRFSQTFTPSAGSTLIGFANDAAHDALDVLIYGAELVAGSSASATYTPQSLNFQLGLSSATESTDPTWTSAGLTFGASKYAKAVNTAALTFTNITLYSVFKKDPSTDAPSFFEPIIISDPGSPYGIIMESRDILNSGTSANSTGPCFGFGFTGHIVNAANVKIDDGQYHIFAGTYDGTNIKLYIDGTQVEQKTHTISSQTIHRFMLGAYEGNNSASTNYFPGSVGMIALYSDAHTATQVRQNTTAMIANMACRGIVIPQMTTVIGVEGDSIPAGSAGGILQYQRWSWLLLQAISPTVQQWDGAVGGSTVATVTSRMSVFNQILSNPSLTKRILILQLGANDLAGSTSAATFVADYKTLVLAEKAAGWDYVYVTEVLPRGDTAATSNNFETKRLAANTAMHADATFNVISFDATIMNVSATSDATLFNGDLVHPTPLAHHDHLEPPIETAMRAILP